MKFYEKKLFLLFFCIACLTFGFLFILTNSNKVYASNLNVTGHAKIMNSSGYLDFADENANVVVDDITGHFSGYAFLESTGWVAFGTQDNPDGPVEVNLTTGIVTGKAKVLNTGAFLDFTNFNSNVAIILSTGIFSGYVWSEDVGWIDFADTGVATAPLHAPSLDIVNSSYEAVTSPAFTMNPTATNFACSTVEGLLGTTAQQIYIDNRTAGLDHGWEVTLAATSPTSLWTNTGVGSTLSYDFNSSDGSGCTNGQLTIDARDATVNHGQNEYTNLITGIIKPGSWTTFNQGTVDSATLLSADDTSDESGDWTLQDINISQKIPAQQAAGNYKLDMMLTFIPGTP